MNSPIVLTPTSVSADAETLTTDSPARRKRNIVAGALVLGACAVACSIPLLAGAGIITLGAGALGGTQGFFAAGLVSLVVIMGVWTVRRRRAVKAAAAHAAAHEAAHAAEPDSCRSDHSCAGSGCGCS